MKQTANSKHALQLILFILCLLLPTSVAMKIRRTWTTKHWCQSVINPEWPFAYSKYKNQTEETKGRVSSNKQDARHVCETKGVQSKCHICEDIKCGEKLEHNCHFQLQGVEWEKMSRNIPTVSDIPWAVGGAHRYDFGGVNTTHVCMYTSSTGPCQSNFRDDYRTCKVRCWGNAVGFSGLNNTAGRTSEVSVGVEIDDHLVIGEWPNSLVGYQQNGLNATPWVLPQPTATWSYPKTNYFGIALTSSSIGKQTNILPQGFTFTLAGSMISEEGFVDGIGDKARFRHPEGLAVDHDGYVYVADTGNHAIRMISPSGNVSTIAGSGTPGYSDGYTINNVSFSSPSGVALWRNWKNQNNGQVELFIADTGNHRIRKITGEMAVDNNTSEKRMINVNVECFSGNCGKDPQAGFSDGNKHQSRFDTPIGIVVSAKGIVYLTDTNNHLIRKIDEGGTASTLVGNLTVAEFNSDGKKLEGCPEPCLTGNQGHQDGDFQESKLSYPTGIALTPDETTLLVTSRHFLRRIDLQRKEVKTVAGGNRESERDGQGLEASFNNPNGIAITNDGFAYLVDSTSCRIRRAAAPSLFVPTVDCDSKLGDFFRPSGCSSYDTDIDDRGFKVTPLSGNIQYNYMYRNWTHKEEGEDFIGRGIKDCVGSPPHGRLDKMQWNESTLIIDDSNFHIREDPNEGSKMKFACSTDCNSTLSIQGFKVQSESDSDNYFTRYTDESSLCIAAMHAGLVTIGDAGVVFLDAIIHRPIPHDSTSIYFKYSMVDGEQLLNSLPDASQYFSLMLDTQDMVIQTIAGPPTVLRGKSCGYVDSIPAQTAKFNIPTAISAFVNGTLNDRNRFLFVADRNNNVIRGISAVCSFPCENGGRCVGPDKCDCKPGWEGIDCSIPICSSICGKRQLCVAPNKCACIPGYVGDGCKEATCVQKCEHGGVCVAPDTCSCNPGWFDSNCTTPVCNQTCGNGGNCTAPNHCTCPSDWQGSDCRVPVCEQTCHNGGWCVAPNTCQCPPDWSGYDCNEPVCHQGFFEPYDKMETTSLPMYWLEYHPCQLEKWCAETNSFHCSQQNREMKLTTPFFGEKWRFQTGRRTRPGTCFMIELKNNALSSFQYLKSWNNHTTPFQRYSNITPNDWISSEPQPWNAHILPEKGYTGPWDYKIDRQVALAELRNVTQGSYKCANGGKCTAPDTCACSNGWIGFDCRVPVCEQGFFESKQKVFVKGRNDPYELQQFMKFLDRNRTYHLNSSGDGYSNPIYFSVQERFQNASFIQRGKTKLGGKVYLNMDGETQGGYECSIRSVTEWEDYRSGYIFEHPNYYSRYMDQKVEFDGNVYTQWENMGWKPTFHKTELLELSLELRHDSDRLFVYTDRGYLRQGQWVRNNEPWSKGYCIIEFQRVCEDPEKGYDLESGNGQRQGFLVQDTDLSFRPRVNYDNNRATLMGEWRIDGGECVDRVIRGCFNNGTCVGPNQCECTVGWNGHDCSIPICQQECKHNGNCTLPNVCTCEKGWKGFDCSTPICAQNCNNGGQCVAPDTCKCLQWENTWRDGRAHGGVPLYQTPNGDPQMTGWTGYDCSTPICVQAESFVLNVDKTSFKLSEMVSLGGHGKDGKLECDEVKCNEFDKMVTMNDGKSFQTGCGFDPIKTGCCYEAPSPYQQQSNITTLKCVKCDQHFINISSESMTCSNEKFKEYLFYSIQDVTAPFRDKLTNEIYKCGPNHSPLYNTESTLTSPYLCERHIWEQGDYIDDAGLTNETGIGASFGLSIGRHPRVNYNNFIRSSNNPYQWTEGGKIYGEGIFACYNGGSCISPDICTCRDGYTGFDCKTPSCRHKQLDGTVVGCLNGGKCIGKDRCVCYTTESILWLEHSSAARAMTGWSGSDCSMPVCVQGYYDPDCNNNPFATGGEGCFRCANGGMCVAPDECQCSEGWTGYDCKTPICRVQATSLIRKQLMTVDEKKIAIFEQDPCGMQGFYNGNNLISEEYRGACILPNQCTCHCKGKFDKDLCQVLGGRYCRKPFQDRLLRFRNLLAPNQLFGTRSCYSGYEGAVDSQDKFISCHMDIYEPSYIIANSISLLFWCSIGIFCSLGTFFYLRVVSYRKFVQEKNVARRLRRGAMIPSNHNFSFVNIDSSKKNE